MAEIELLSKATGRNVFRKLADDFLSDLAGRLALITAALEARNLSQLASLVHPLKSASAIIGAKQFSDVCAKVERYAIDGNADQAIALARVLLEAARMLPDALLGAAVDR
jgi:HPt (histidine-containing phosphotransfer) domain-containing protein